jgi:peptide/nickel transport system permease protein
VAAVLVVGLPLGVASGIGHSSRKVKAGARLVGALGAGTPDFVLGTILVYVFSVWSLGLTVGGYVPFVEDPGTNLRAMALPTLTLSVFGIALILRTTRESVLGVMTSGHITTAVARGDSSRQIIVHQVFRNASLPVLTVTTMYFSALIGGAVIVETLFSIPGIGLYTWNSLHNRDYVVTQSAVLIFSAVLVVFNMVVDIAYALLDPRIKTRQR